MDFTWIRLSSLNDGQIGATYYDEDCTGSPMVGPCLYLGGDCDLWSTGSDCCHDASAMSEERDRCLAAGMDDFIPKAVNHKVIDEMITATFAPGK
jgi:hypothetical protein